MRGKERHETEDKTNMYHLYIYISALTIGHKFVIDKFLVTKQTKDFEYEYYCSKYIKKKSMKKSYRYIFEYTSR